MSKPIVYKVYIASPYTKGDTAVNVKTQMDFASLLMLHNFAPFWPLHSHFLHMMHPQPYEKWLEWDFEWVLACDALVRLPGESPGADEEVKVAKRAGIPVFEGMYDLLQWREAKIKKQFLADTNL